MTNTPWQGTRSVLAVTPVHNRRDITLQGLGSLFDLQAIGIDLHVIVVDDGSTDGTSEAIRKEFPEVELLQGDGTLFYSGGTNRGLEAALEHGPDYILTFNDDSLFDEQLLVELVGCAEDRDRAVVGPLLIDWDDRETVLQVDPRWVSWKGGWQWRERTISELPDEPFPVEFIAGNCILFPREAIEDVGLMDEDRFPHWGDAEYTPRLRRAGWNLFINPRAVVYMQPNEVSEGLTTKPFRDAVREVFFDRSSPRHIVRRWNRLLYGAPSKPQGLVAFASQFGEAIVKLFRRKVLGRGPGREASEDGE